MQERQNAAKSGSTIQTSNAWPAIFQSIVRPCPTRPQLTNGKMGVDQAAGVAAAMTAQSNQQGEVRAVPMAALRERLLRDGAKLA